VLRILSLVSAGTPWRVRVCSCAARANLIRLGGSFRTGVGLACVIDLNYDRRGRGDRGDTAPCSVDREIEDIDALVAEAGGSSAVFGNSTTAPLAKALEPRFMRHFVPPCRT
jgi:hypothetical protein